MAAACSESGSSPPDSERERLLDQAFAVADSNPAHASTLFADAGPGASLENSRMAVWATCLERTTAGPDEWRRYLNDRPPEDLAVRARLALISALVDQSEVEAAVGERSFLPAESRSKADELLYAVADPTTRAEAAERLSISSPSFLSAADSGLDRQLASKLQSLEGVPVDALRRVSRGLDALSAAEAGEMGEIYGQVWAPLSQAERRRLARVLERVKADRPVAAADVRALREVVKAGVVALPPEQRARLQELSGRALEKSLVLP